MLVVRLLGGLTVTDDDVTMAAPRGRCAALLAWLALHPGMQPRGRVAARLWPDVMDESARRSLRTALLDLRGELGPHVAGHLLGTRDEIGLGPEVRVDVRDFADAAADGRLAEAFAIGAAGELLPGLDHEWAYEAREEHERRLAEIVERLAIDAEQRGDPGAAVEYTRRLVALDPLCEEHARSLMRRLALTEDRAAALTVFEQHRERLRSDLRMAPSAATRALADEIRDGGGSAVTASAAARVATPARAERPSLPGPLALAAGAGPLVGREDELAELEATWDAVADGHPRLCLVTGEAGIGKSRLIAELAQVVAAAGAPVLYGACVESPRPPYGPFVDAISLDLRGLDPVAAGRRLGTVAGELSRIVPELRDRFGTAAHVSGESPAGEQMRLFGAVGDYLQHTAQPRALVVIEDIHWAASGTLAMLAHIVRTAAGSILLVVSSRDVPPDLTSALSTFLSDLGRHPAVRRIGLGGLTEPDVEALLRATAGRAALDVARTARMLHGATGGSPLFLREVVRELPADGLLRTVPVSPTVRDHVAAALRAAPGRGRSDARRCRRARRRVRGAHLRAGARPAAAGRPRCARPRRRPRHRRSGPRGRGTLRLHPRASARGPLRGDPGGPAHATAPRRRHRAARRGRPRDRPRPPLLRGGRPRRSQGRLHLRPARRRARPRALRVRRRGRLLRAGRSARRAAAGLRPTAIGATLPSRTARRCTGPETRATRRCCSTPRRPLGGSTTPTC